MHHQAILGHEDSRPAEPQWVRRRATTFTWRRIDPDGALGVLTHHLTGWCFCGNQTVPEHQGRNKTEEDESVPGKHQQSMSLKTNRGRRDLREHAVQARRPIGDKTEDRVNGGGGGGQILAMPCHSLLRFGHKMPPHTSPSPGLTDRSLIPRD